MISEKKRKKKQDERLIKDGTIRDNYVEYESNGDKNTKEDTKEERVMHLNSDNIKFTSYIEVNEVVN